MRVFSRRLRRSRRGMQQAALFRRERQLGVNVVFVVCLRKSAKSAGDFWGFVCANRLSKLACYSPADNADDAEECSGAALYRRERQIGMVVAVIAVLLFWVSFEIICVI